MTVTPDSFTIAQTIVFLAIALISFLLSILIYRKDPSYKLNISFSLGIAIMGGSYAFSFLSNVFYILDGQSDPIYIRTAFFLAPIAFIFYYFTSVGIYKGGEYMYSKLKILISIIIIIINFFVLYFDNGVYYITSTDTNSSLLFKLTNLLVVLILYLLVYYYFIRSYFGVDDDFVKSNIEYFLIGWFFGGLGLLSIFGSDYIRELDLLGPIFICIAVIIISRSFLKRKPEGTT